MKVKLLILFFVITFLLPLSVFVMLGLSGVQPAFWKYYFSIGLSLCSAIGFALYLSKRKNLRWYWLLLTLVFSLLIELGVSPLRKYVNFHFCSVVTFILFFIFQYFILKKYEKKLKAKYILISALIGCALVQVPVRIIYFTSTIISLPDFLFHLLGIVLGYLFYFSNRNFRIIILAFSFSSCIFLYFKGYDMWLHKLDFNTFTGVIKEDNQEYNLLFQTNAGDTLSLSDFKGKYLLLDCWFTYCGVCYEEMPSMQQLYDDYKQNPEIALYAMHSFIKEPRRDDPSENYATGSEILEKEGFSYPCLSIDIYNPVLKELGVNAYPTVLIFDKQSNLIFRGDIKNAKKLIKKLLKENGE